MDIILQQLRDLEETLLIEILEIKSDDIVDRFQDVIEDRIAYIRKQLEEKDSYY